jgi:steroid 5-alpha reductase family enzyme
MQQSSPDASPGYGQAKDRIVPADAFPTTELLTIFVASTAVMLALWVRQIRTRNATSVDVAWTVLIGAAGVVLCATGDGAALPRLLGATTLALWSGRLAWHLVRDRLLRHREEDRRYRALRERLGQREATGMLLVYLLQAVLVVVFAAPFAAIAADDRPEWRVHQVVALVVVACGLAIETIADRQLAAHKASAGSRGLTCRRGLWRHSRHPNYFGEWLVWCGFGLLGARAPHAWLSLQAPIVMFVFVRFLSGVPPAETQALKTRGDDYRRYQWSTNAFFPGPSRDIEQGAPSTANRNHPQ